MSEIKDVVRRYGGKTGERILTAIAVGQALAPVAKWVVEKHRAKRPTPQKEYVLTIRPNDSMFSVARAWLFASLPESKRRAVELQSLNKEPYYVYEYDETTKQVVVVDGHAITTELLNEEEGGSRSPVLRLTCRSQEARDLVALALAGKLRERWTDRGGPPATWTPNQYGEWNQRPDLKPRPLESVILKDGQLEDLLHDVQAFIDAEEDYQILGQPWHRGYLFHGPPGTGKTSVARAIANHFKMPIFYLTLADISKDSDLVSLVSLLHEKSILLLEDADGFHSTTSRDEESETASMSTVLNVLDGLWTPHGLVTIMTTNHVESLDDAMTRKGRADVHEEFTELDESQARRLAEYVDLQAPYEAFVGLPPADLLAEAHRERFSAKVKVQ